MWNNFGTLRELIQNNTIFVKVQITQYWNFQRDTTKQDILCQSSYKTIWYFQRVTTNQCYTHFSELISHYTFSESYFKRILNIFSEFRSNNIDIYRVAAKHYCKIILSYKFYKKTLTFSEVPQNTNTFSTEDIPDNTSFPLRCELILNLYWLD